MSKRRVVVTGIGAVTPVGLNIRESWENILAGKSGVSRIDRIDTQGYSVKIGGAIRGLDISQYITAKEAKKMDVYLHYGLVAAQQAVEDSGIKAISEKSESKAERIGVAIGSGIGGLEIIENNYRAYLEKGPRRISPFVIPGSLVSMVAGYLSIMYGFKGPNIAISTACSTGTHNIGDAARLIEYGDADVMVAGGAESGITYLGLGGFASARALSTRNDDPQAASRPWDKDRDGFVLGDGAGVVVLEEYEHAKSRNANIYAELTGYGMSADAYHITAPAPGGDGARRCMQMAIAHSGSRIDEIAYINAHGTSTPTGDVAETQAIKSVFKERAYKVAVSSTKSAIGHLLGAAGGVEAIFTVLAIRDQVVPPTINYDTPDPQCDLDYVPNESRAVDIKVALSNSFGFGGTNATLVFAKI